MSGLTHDVKVEYSPLGRYRSVTSGIGELTNLVRLRISGILTLDVYPSITPEHVPRIASLSLVLGIVYMVVLVIEVRGFLHHLTGTN